MGITTADRPPVDPAKLAALRAKYDEEAKKRLRPQGTKQFIQLSEAEEERLRDLVADPRVDHDALNARPSPITDGETYRYLVVGAGQGGLHFAVRLIEEGLARPEDIRLVDAGGDFGGTWYWNRFPGLHCDIESYVYLPLLEETGYVPSAKYAPGDEIRQQSVRVAEQWQLTDKALFRADVTDLSWDDRDSLWRIGAVEGRGPREAPIRRQFQAEYVYLAAGILTKPQVPNVPGLLSFSGPIWHTARWNYGVSGGTPTDQRLTGLRGKRVAVVGTAATAIAVVPEVAKWAAELFVVQRTPPQVWPRNQRPTDLDEFRSKIAANPGWQHERAVNLNKWQSNSTAPGEPNLVDDGWTHSPAYSVLLGTAGHTVLQGPGGSSPAVMAEHVRYFHELDYPTTEALRARVDSIVRDRATADKLKPWYPTWCKRPTFSDAYLQTFNRPNVHLVDTDGRGLEAATPSGIVVAEGKETIPVDIIIFGTGYDAPLNRASPAARTGVDIRGRHGASLDREWSVNGTQTVLGLASAGFPNLFFSGSSQATVTGNNVFMLGLIARNVAYILRTAQQQQQSIGPGRRAIIEATGQGQAAHTREIVKRAPFFAPLAGCTPGNFNGHGEAHFITDPAEKLKRAQGSIWSHGTVSWNDYVQRWKDAGNLDGFSVTPAPARSSL